MLNYDMYIDAMMKEAMIVCHVTVKDITNENYPRIINGPLTRNENGVFEVKEYIDTLDAGDSPTIIVNFGKKHIKEIIISKYNNDAVFILDYSDNK